MPARLLSSMLLVFLVLTLLPLACTLRSLSVATGGMRDLDADARLQPCVHVDVRCDDNQGDGAAPPRPSAPTSPPPACESLCQRAEQTYHDPRTQVLLADLAQTPTGRGSLEYLLAMGARLGEDFISWHDLGSRTAGSNNDGGFVQLNSALLADSRLGAYDMAGTLVHESVESYFDVAAGIRQMGTRHADYVAQWFAGKFETELHAIPYYYAHDPFDHPAKDSSYTLSYSAWLFGTENGQLYLTFPADCDLHAIDRKGHAWPPSDWWAEQGGFWMLGQGTDVMPIPDSLGLTPAMLVADDLASFSQPPVPQGAAG
jgi:hypothetical protein